MEKKIVVMHPCFTEKYREKMSGVAKDLGYEIHFYKTVDEAVEDAGNAEILFGQKDDFFRAGKEARWICATSAGVNTFLKEGVIPREDCILTNSSGSYGVAIAEHLIMVTLMLLRRMDYYEEAMAQRRWPVYVPVRSIKDSRITIAGTGNLGASFARRLKAFEPARISGINRSGNCPDGAFGEIIKQADQEKVDALLGETDILALCLPSTPETIGFLSEERISILGPQTYVINVGRGDAIDQAALIRALNEERIAGAALDVMATEPVPEDDPIWEAKNCLLTPHCSGNMSLDYTVDMAADLFLENLKLYSQGRPMKRVVDRTRGY